MLHSVTAVYPVFPFNLQGFETLFAVHLLAHPFSLIANLVSMMETGVPERFPELKIAFTEGGVGWVPWIMLRMDKEYAERRREVPILKDRPSNYVRRMFFATQPIEEPEHLADMATLLTLFGGEDSVCVCLRLAAPRFRPPQQGAADPALGRGAAQDHGPECPAPAGPQSQPGEPAR